MTSDLLTASFDGQLDTRDPIAFNAKRTELSVTDLRAAAQWLGTPWPEGDGLRDFRAQGPMTWNDGRLSFERAQYSIDGSSGSGALSVSLTTGSPVIEGTVAFESLEIAPYLNLKSQDQQPFLLSGIFPAIAETRGSAAQSIITEVDADLRISAAKVTVNGANIGRGAATLGIRDRVLRADFAEVALNSGGTGSANLQIDMKTSTPQVSLRSKLSEIDIGGALESVSGHTVLEGQGTIDANLTGQGRSSREIIASLNGDLSIALPAGGALTFDIEGLRERAANAPVQGWDETSSMRTPLKSLSSKFTAKDGTFTATEFAATTPKGALTMSGTFRPSVDNVELTLGEPAAPQQGSAEPQQQHVTIRGSWLGPEIRQIPHAESPPPR